MDEIWFIITSLMPLCIEYKVNAIVDISTINWKKKITHNIDIKLVRYLPVICHFVPFMFGFIPFILDF